MQSLKNQSWTAHEQSILHEEAQKSPTKAFCFKTVSQRTGRTVTAVRQYYYDHAPQASVTTHRPWTKEEEECLLRYIRVYGAMNLSACFIAVAEQIDRTPKAVSHHWYKKLSRKPNVREFFTLSRNHLAINHKNTGAMKSGSGIWQRILRILCHFSA